MNLRDLAGSGPVLVDGAWGTELQKRGMQAGECPDSWNLSRPEFVAEVARAYVDAGSRIILTNTFRAKIALSREAANGRALVFASLGPTGKVLSAGEISDGEVLAAFEEQAAALAEGGADALAMSDVSESALALAAAHKTGLPVIVSFTFDTGKKKVAP
jgi:methionine synthase I (cobalamin-dependent)